jgi:5'(3')-deoxyribonucleotidase
MKIGIDMDDVCADFQTSYVTLLNKLYGKPPLGTAPIDWEGSNLQLTPEETTQSWIEVAKVKNFWSSLKPLPSFDLETMLLLTKLVALHDVFFVTNRFDTPGASPLKQTKYWLYLHASIQAPNVLIAKEKGPMASVLQLDVFIDDRPKNLIDVLAARPNAKIYLADSSHNQNFNDPRFPRVKDLKEFLKLILEAN